MEKSTVSKISTMSFLGAGILTWLVVGILFRTLAGAFGAVQKLYGVDLLNHGLPLVAGALVFIVLQFSPKITVWAEEVILEVSKVVWPTQKDTVGMTIVVIIMVLIASAILFIFDNIARLIMSFIIG